MPAWLARWRVDSLCVDGHVPSMLVRWRACKSREWLCAAEKGLQRSVRFISEVRLLAK